MKERLIRNIILWIAFMYLSYRFWHTYEVSYLIFATWVLLMTIYWELKDKIEDLGKPRKPNLN